MTNAEAIKQLQGMVVGAEWLSDYMVEALDMAIAALGKDIDVPSNDLVSRQVVRDTVNAWTYNLCDPEDEWAAMKEVKDLPSAQPEIIRCGECMHKDKKIDYCHYLGITICESDYCSYAERRTDG